MRVGNALGLPGRSRRVDRISNVLAGHHDREILRVVGGDGLPVSIQADNGRFGSRQVIEQVLLREDDRGICVLQHALESLAGILWIKQYVGTTRFD